jgi:hypothetical protein
MSTNETTGSLLHYNDCAADSGAPCTCEPPLTTVEEVAEVLFGCHVLEFIDADTGWACGCDEDGYLELLTLDDARKHQAQAMLAEVTPLIKAQALAEVRENQIALAHAYQHSAQREEGRVDRSKWTPAHSLAYAQGEARGAVNAFQLLLMELGEVEFDEAAECTWDIVQNWPAGGSR